MAKGINIGNTHDWDIKVGRTKTRHLSRVPQLRCKRHADGGRGGRIDVDRRVSVRMIGIGLVRIFFDNSLRLRV